VIEPMGLIMSPECCRDSYSYFRG